MGGFAGTLTATIAVNMATFIGASRAGLAGAFFATLGVVLPAFLIILCIAALIRNLLILLSAILGLVFC